MQELPINNIITPKIKTFDNGVMLYQLNSETTELLKMDFIFEAGSRYQPQALCASSVNSLMVKATKTKSAQQLSEILDYHGIVVEPNCDIMTSSVTFYMLRKYASTMLPLIRDIIVNPAFENEDVTVLKNKRRQEIEVNAQKSASVARKLFYQTLFGEQHPLGIYAKLEDADRLNREVIERFHEEYYVGKRITIIAAGMVDDGLVKLIEQEFGRGEVCGVQQYETLQMPTCLTSETRLHQSIATSQQTSLRIGRVIPVAWDSPEFSRLMLVNTLLGGYFGSRLMSNIREDKGLTYGIYSHLQLYRGGAVFSIVSDIMPGKVDEAISEVVNEIERLQSEPVNDSELLMVKNVMMGDFMRSIDGIFEQSARFCDMMVNDVDERLSKNINEAIKKTNAEHIMDIARRLLNIDDLLFCTAGI